MDHAAHDAQAITSSWVWAAFLLTLALLYSLGLHAQPRGKVWSISRAACWYAGLTVAGTALVGPVATKAHGDFAWHMGGHLLLGMLAPILLVLGAPVTLALRALPVERSRRLARLLASPLLHVLTHPITAAVLNTGGLIALYTTSLYEAMHQHIAVSILAHLHVLFAGYLFTAALIGVDPAPRWPSWLYRAIVFVVALSAHSILAKLLYAHPPRGVPLEQAQTGSLLMYYGGDAIDLLLIIIFCHTWYVATRPRPAPRPHAA
jgi:putative membrane protein